MSEFYKCLPALALVVSVACSTDPTAGRRRVSIAAAADLKFALDQVVADFAKLHPGIRVDVTYGSSGNFYAQLQNQAPFDLFLSADMEYPARLIREGLTLPGTEFTYAVGRLAVWVPADSAIDPRKLGIHALQDPAVIHIAIANPQHAPYGRAAEAAMRSLGVYESIRQKLIRGENVAQTLQFVQSGNAQIGIVALSLAISPSVRAQGRYWEVPLESYPRMEQGGVILKWTKEAGAARSFRAYLTGLEGRSTLKSFGFTLPGE